MKSVAREAVDTPRWVVPSLFAVAFVLYGRALGDEYVFDGVPAIRDNALLAPFEPLRIAALDWWAGTGRPGGLYRPVALVWLAALKQLGGVGAIDFGNLVLHACVAWARFALIKRLLARSRASWCTAWLAALLALVSPLAVEVVAGQVGATDLLATLLATCAVLAADGPALSRAIAGAALAALALLAKESALAVVPMAVLFEALRAESPNRVRRAVRAALWSSTGVAVALACRYAAIGSLASVDDPVYAGFTALARSASALATFATYTLPLLIAPWRQLAVVGHQDVAPALGPGDPRALLGAVALLALVVTPLFALRRGKREIAFGAWLFVAAWLPTSNLLVSSGALAASRFLYFGLVGLTLPLASTIVAAWSRGPRARAVACALLAWFGGVFAALTWSEVPAWSSQRALFELDVARAPRSAYGLVDLATRLRAVEPARAEALFLRAAELPLPNVPGQSYAPEDLLESAFVARVNRAQLAAARGDRATAQADFELAAQLAARGVEANSAWPQRNDWNVHRAYALRQIARTALDAAPAADDAARAALLDRAQRALDESDACEPDATESIELRARWFQAHGDARGRREFVERAYRSKPNDPSVRALWAAELRQSGRNAEALAIELDVALGAVERLDPARALALGKEALASGDRASVERGRQLLTALVRRAGVPPQISAEAARLLAAPNARG